jgi:hypothetical protein
MLTLRFAITPDDFANFSAYVHLEAPGKKKQLFKKYLPLIIILSIFLFINITSGIFSDSIDLTVYIGFAVFISFMLINFFSIRPRLKKQAQKFAADSENAAVFNMIDYTFSETGLLTKDNFKETKFQWPAFIKKGETADYFFLFIYSASAIIIPKRIFKSTVEKEKLEALLATHLSFDAEVGHLIKTN